MYFDQRRQPAAPLTVRWLNPEPLFEEKYWELRLSTLRENSGGLNFGDLLVFGGHREVASPSVRETLSMNPRSFVMILSDEELRHKFRPYRRRPGVLRNYFQPSWNSRKVYTLPLGFNPELVGLNKGPSQKVKRVHAWGFVGEVKQNREKVLQLFEDLEPHALFRANKFNDPAGLRGGELYDTYERCHFVLCPFGNRSPDSFRVMEALEAGAIPVTVAFLGYDHNRFVFGDHPFVVGKDWCHAKHLVEDLLDNPDKLKAKQEQTQTWYREFIESLDADLERILSGSRRSLLVSTQFRYQRRARWNIILRVRYLLHYSRRARRILRFMRESLNAVAVSSKLSRFLRA